MTTMNKFIKSMHLEMEILFGAKLQTLKNFQDYFWFRLLAPKPKNRFPLSHKFIGCFNCRSNHCLFFHIPICSQKILHKRIPLYLILMIEFDFYPPAHCRLLKPYFKRLLIFMETEGFLVIFYLYLFIIFCNYKASFHTNEYQITMHAKLSPHNT